MVRSSTDEQLGMAYAVQKKSVSAPSRSTSSAAEFLVATWTAGCKSKRDFSKSTRTNEKGGKTKPGDTDENGIREGKRRY